MYWTTPFIQYLLFFWGVVDPVWSHGGPHCDCWSSWITLLWLFPQSGFNSTLPYIVPISDLAYCKQFWNTIWMFCRFMDCCIFIWKKTLPFLFHTWNHRQVRLFIVHYSIIYIIITQEEKRPFFLYRES
jgi:hypothetical protein